MTSAQSISSILISGASTGIGRCCAQYLADHGYRVYAGVRRETDAEALIKDNPAIRPVILDVTDPESIAACRCFVENDLGESALAGLVNNAGIAIGGPVEFVPLDDWRRQMEINLFGQIGVIQAFLPLLRQTGGRGHSPRIVNMGSIAGLSALPFAAPYSASKFALEALTDALRVELRPWSIQVSIVEPGSIATPLWQKSLNWADEAIQRISPEISKLYGPQMEAMLKATEDSARRGIEPEHVARVVHHAISARQARPRYLVGPDARIRPLFAQLPEPIKDWLITKKVGLP